MWMLAAFAKNRSPRVTDGVVHVSLGTSAGTYLLVLATALIVGLRYGVGADWSTYLDHYNQVQLLSFLQSAGRFEIGYATLVFIAGRLDTGIWLSNLICAIIMTLGIARFCTRQPNPALSFLVAIPYLVIVVGMGYTRQAVAIGLILAGLADADGRSTWKLIIYVLAATLFHRTALLVLPLVLSPLFRRNLLYALAGGAVFVILFYLLVNNSADQLVSTYVNGDYESSGAIVRVGMNIVPAALALILRRRLGFNSYQSDVWSVFAIVSLGTFGLVLVTNFSTAIDRLGLFLIPLQLAILPRVPYILGLSRGMNAQLIIGVCGYSAAVQFVWLVFSDHADAWVPYQAYIMNLN